jgi:uncharacterized protein
MVKMNSSNFNYRLLSGVLAVIILLLLALWQPWQGTDKQSVTISGQATVRAVPDKFIFSPAYQAEAASSQEAISEVSERGNAVSAGLQELGVEERLIKTSVSAYPKFDDRLLREPAPSGDATSYTAQYSFTVTVNDKDLAQKVLDYLVGTSPIYGVSPQSTFQDETRKTLENQARQQAITDARLKAEATASGLGSRLGRAISVSEPQWGGVIPFAVGERTAPDVADSSSTASTPPVLLTGEEEVTYTIQVVFRLR